MPLKKKTLPAGSNAVIYARYSSSNQREESIEQQIKKCREFAERKKLEIIDIYSDAAISGKSDDRPQFQRMLRDSQKGKFQYVIAWKSSRIGRNMMQALQTELALQEVGVRCLYVEEYFEDSPSGRFALRNMMNVNQFYIENMAEDILRGLMDNAEKCMMNTRPPFGYKKGDDGKFAINEATAPIVREIFQKYLDGWAFIDIARDLNRRGLRTSYGNQWNKGSFHTMLRNEMYTGVYSYRDVRKEGGVPVIIKKEMFEEVQRRLQAKKTPRGKKSGTADYLLTGKLFCGHCQEPMVGISGTGKNGGVHYYYRCQGKHERKNGCQKKNVRKDLIEKAVIDNTMEFIMNDAFIDRLIESYHRFMEAARQESELVAMEKELMQNKRATENLLKSLEYGPSETIRARLDELEKERISLERDIMMEQASLVEFSPDQMRFYVEKFRQNDVNDPAFQRDLINIFVQAIYLFDDRLKIVYNFDNNSEHFITFQQACGEDSSDVICSCELPSGVLMVDDTNPLTVTLFVYGLVLSASF